MKKYENIIVPTDGSANSKRALEHAVVIASSVGAAITLVYVANIVSVISNFDQIPNASGYVTEQVALDMEEAGKSVLDEFAKAIPQDVAVKSVFEVGSPGPAILSVAKKYNADLIVMLSGFRAQTIIHDDGSETQDVLKVSDTRDGQKQLKSDADSFQQRNYTVM